MFTSDFVARFHFCHVCRVCVCLCVCTWTQLDYESCGLLDVVSVATRWRTCSVCVQVMFSSFLLISSSCQTVCTWNWGRAHGGSEAETKASAQELSTQTTTDFFGRSKVQIWFLLITLDPVNQKPLLGSCLHQNLHHVDLSQLQFVNVSVNKWVAVVKPEGSDPSDWS